MSYTLEDFCEEVRTLLKDDGPAAREAVRQKLEALLIDPAFCAEYAGQDNAPGMVQIHQDPVAHFCVLAYNMPADRTSPPHDHGSSWAVYGQVAGYTDMTIWREDAEGKVTEDRQFRLNPGQAGLFDVKQIHSIQYPAGSKFVRVTGVDMSKDLRRVFDPKTGEVREIKHVGTGSG